MRISKNTLILASLLLGIASVAAATPKKHTNKRYAHASLKYSFSRHHAVAHAAMHHEAASVKMPAERATQIQTALIKQGYLTGEPTGTWDAQSISAMQKLQSDNGWQSKVTPDSRALIKLGLGPETPGGQDASNTVAQTQPQ